VQVLLFLAALTIGGLLIWLKATPRIVVALAFFVGLNLGGWLRKWIALGVDLGAKQIGHFGADLVGKPADALSAAVPAVIGLGLLIIVVRQVWPKKGKPTLVTAAAALALPMFWSAMVAGMNTVSAGATAGGA
jgi:hypothetical protein